MGREERNGPLVAVSPLVEDLSRAARPLGPDPLGFHRRRLPLLLALGHAPPPFLYRPPRRLAASPDLRRLLLRKLPPLLLPRAFFIDATQRTVFPVSSSRCNP